MLRPLYSFFQIMALLGGIGLAGLPVLPAFAAATQPQPLPLAPTSSGVTGPTAPNHLPPQKQRQQAKGNATLNQEQLSRIFAIQGDPVGLSALFQEDGNSASVPGVQPGAIPAATQQPAPAIQPQQPSPSPYQELIQAVVLPYNSIILTAPFAGKVSKVLVYDGDTVSKGQELVLMYNGPLEAELALAKSSLAAMATEFASKTEATQAERHAIAEKMQKATDEISILEERLARSVLRAPFAGKITELNARQEQEYEVGTPLIELAENGLLKIECTAPSRYVQWLKPGTVLEIHIHETQKVYAAKVRRLGGKIDPQKRAVKVYAAFDSEPQLLPGMSGLALIVRPAP